MKAKSYLRFGAMIATSTLVMFGLMYLNTYQLDHIRFSETRAWMALVMGAVMAVIMLLFMLKMYTDKRLNLAIIGGAVLVFAGSLWLVRSQETVNDVDYMRAMIPHHSIAILTSERAHIRDPRVRKLADGIIEAQKREIAEMDALIADLERNPTPSSPGVAGWVLLGDLSPPCPGTLFDPMSVAPSGHPVLRLGKPELRRVRSGLRPSPVLPGGRPSPRRRSRPGICAFKGPA